MPRLTQPKSGSQPVRTPKLTSQLIFSSKKSPLLDPGKVDLQAFLEECLSNESWSQYNQDEKELILQALPTSIKVRLQAEMKEKAARKSDDTVEPSESTLFRDSPVQPSEIASNEYLKSAIIRFERDVADGYHEKAWQNKAQRAQQARREGFFDDYQRLHAEEMFGDASETESGDELALSDSDGEYSTTGNQKRKKQNKS